MKKLPEGLLDRYDWKHATRARLAKRLAKESSNLRALDDDLAKEFPDSNAVNEALRALVALRATLMPRKTKAKRSRRAA